MRSALLSVVVLSGTIIAQSSAPLDPKISDALPRMKSSDLKQRQVAFDEVMNLIADEQGQSAEGDHVDVAGFLKHHPDQADRLTLSLTQLLKSENDVFVHGAPGSLTEEDGEYYAAVITTVASLDDDRAIPALVGAMTSGGIAQEGLLKYGDRALGVVLVQLKNPDPVMRASALGMSITLLMKKGDPSSHARISELIKLSLSDREAVVRGHAVREIECIDDRQNFVPILEHIAKNDPQKLPGKALDGEDGNEFYPVRYDARQVLRDIQSGKTCEH